MRVEHYPQVAVIRSDTAEQFEKEFNRRIKELSEHKILDRQISFNGDSITAVITYQLTEHIMDCIADEFHAEGITYLCKQCPFLEDPKDARVKRCICKYAELGTTHKEHEACELFYKLLKQGSIEPVDYIR